MDPTTIKQENVEYQLLSPISSSSPMASAKASKFNVVKVTPTTRRIDPAGGVGGSGGRSETTSDHEYFSTPSSSGAQQRVYLTPSSGAGRGGATMASFTPTNGTLLVPAQKVEARRRLNLDSAPVDREGFKTPIKGASKRRADFSSPSPKKCKSFANPNQHPKLTILLCSVFSNSKISPGENEVRDLPWPPHQEVRLPVPLFILGHGRPQQSLRDAQRAKAEDLRHHQRPGRHRAGREEEQEHGRLVGRPAP